MFLSFEEAAVLQDDEIIIPFNTEVNPSHDGARERHYKWLKDMRILQTPEHEARMREVNMTILTAMAYPDVQPSTLDLFLDFTAWTAPFDDFCDITTGEKADFDKVSSFIRIFRDSWVDNSPMASDVPLVTSWRELLRRFKECASEQWLQKWHQRWTVLYDAFDQEAWNSENKSIPTYDQYFPLREAASGVPIFLLMNDMQLRISDEVYTNHDFRGMEEFTAYAIDLPNDLFSLFYEEEMKNSDNLVTILTHHHNFSREKAINTVRGMTNKAIQEFQKAESRFLNSPIYKSLSTEELKGVDFYIAGMKIWIRAAWEWYKVTKKYVPAGWSSCNFS